MEGGWGMDAEGVNVHSLPEIRSIKVDKSLPYEKSLKAYWS